MAEFKLNYTGEEVQEKLDNCGSGGVTSWNDLTDKPFETVIADDYTALTSEFSVTTNEHGTSILEYFPFIVDRDIVVGNTYGVLVNGVRYLVKAEEDEGNNTMSPGWRLNVPNQVCLYYAPSAGYTYVSGAKWGEANTEYTVQIVEYQMTVKTIDSMFLPKATGVWVATEDTVVSTVNELIANLKAAGYLGEPPQGL